MIPLLSVIVPVYNAERTLDKCIGSILEQTYGNFELLLIDDGSKDNSLEICNAYKEKDVRVVVIHKSNSGVSRTRNLGIENARGEWVTFVDSDDYITVDYLEKLISATFDKQIDFVVGGCYTCRKDCCTTVCFETNEYFDEKNIGLFFRKYIDSSLLKVNLSKLYKKSILNTYRIRYNENLRLSEDALFVLEYLSHVSSAQTISAPIYYYELPESLGLKYGLKFDEAVYKSRKIEEQLLKIEEKYKVDTSVRNKHNWHNSLGCIDIREYFNPNIYLQIVREYQQHVGNDITQDINCNLYLKSIMYLLLSEGLTANIRDEIFRLLYPKNIHAFKTDKLCCSRKIKIASSIYRYGNKALFGSFIKLARRKLNKNG